MASNTNGVAMSAQFICILGASNTTGTLKNSLGKPRRSKITAKISRRGRTSKVGVGGLGLQPLQQAIKGPFCYVLESCKIFSLIDIKAR
jgi:hypothetical protein